MQLSMCGLLVIRTRGTENKFVGVFLLIKTLLKASEYRPSMSCELMEIGSQDKMRLVGEVPLRL